MEQTLCWAFITRWVVGMHKTVNWDTIGLSASLTPAWCQVISWPNGNVFSVYLNQYSRVVNCIPGGNVYQNMVCSIKMHPKMSSATLQWRHNERDGVSNHRRLHCFLNCWFSPDQRKHQSSVSLAFVRVIHRWPVNSPHKRPVTRKLFLFDDVIMKCQSMPQWGYCITMTSH